MTSVRTSVCIVGGEPGGLTLGLLLAKRGDEVLVLEGHEDFEREFRAAGELRRGENDQFRHGAQAFRGAGEVPAR